MNKNIKDKLENMKSIKLTESEKDILWSKVEGGIRARQVHGKKSATMFGMSTRLVAALVLSAFVLTSGSAFTVSAANAANPGDRLFPVDEAIERIELFFTRQEEKTERRLEHAVERLEEARYIIALADTDSATSTDDTSTSTDTTYKSKRIKRAEHVLDVALERLEAIREELLAEGDDAGVAAIDATIADLTLLAESHVAYLEGLESDIHEARNEIGLVRREVNQSKSELKFKFDHRVEGDDGDEDEDEDDNDKSNRGRSFSKFFGFGSDDKDGHKTVMCHIPPGNPDEEHTISVGSPAAERGHRAHGDFEGRCDRDENDDDDDEDEDGEAKLTVIKIVENNDNGTSTIEDFTLFVGNEEVESGEDEEFEPGVYTVSETGPGGYEATFSGACNVDGEVTLEDDDDVTCTIVNDYVDEVADVTAPVITGVVASNTASTTEISWDTDEDSDSEVWFSTSPTVDTSVASNENSATLETAHIIPVTGLTASTTYYYVVGSTDGSGNSATSTEDSFTTL